MAKKRYSLDIEPRSDEPIGFFLGDEEFTCLDDAPAVAKYALLTSGPIVGTLTFIRGVLIAEDEDRFDELLGRKDVIVTDVVLAAVLGDLQEVYTGRPTRRPSSSPGGPQATNDGSPGSSTSEDEASR